MSDVNKIEAFISVFWQDVLDYLPRHLSESITEAWRDPSSSATLLKIAIEKSMEQIVVEYVDMLEEKGNTVLPPVRKKIKLSRENTDWSF